VLKELRKRRQERLDRYDLGSSLDDIKKKLDEIVKMEREGIDRRVNDRFPVATLSIIAVNTAIFILMYLVAEGREELTALYFKYGAVPGKIQLHAILSHMFMHASAEHLVGNMVFLALFGMNVERRAGVLAYLTIYFLSGLSSIGLFLLFNPFYSSFFGSERN
jgi:membrane associated rhomboid family serine protease